MALDTLSISAFPSDLPVLPEGWTYELLGSLVDSRGISYGVVQPGAGDPAGVPIARVNNIKNGRLDPEDVLRISPEIEAKYARTRLRGGEVLLTLVGSLGECAVVSSDLVGWNVARAVGVIPVRPEYDPRWIALCLRSATLQHFMSIWATTTVQATLNLRDVAKLPIPIPPLGVRESIVEILSSLDDKIDLNRRMNDTLEAMARAIFKSWFVDFDPVRAKMEGGKPVGMDAETAGLFPSSLDGLGNERLPCGWHRGTISDLGPVICGKTPPTEDPENFGGDVPFVTIPDMHNQVFVIATARSLSSKGVATQPAKSIPAGSIMVSCIATPGLVAITATDSQTNQQINSLVPSHSDRTYFCYFALRELADEIRAKGSGGSVVLNMNRTQFCALALTMPAEAAIPGFNRLVEPLFLRILSNQREAATLAEIRDTLLPKLLSGEIRVKEAERLIEAKVP